MPIFVCVVEDCFFNHRVYKKGETAVIEDSDLIGKMGGRFVSKDDYDKTVLNVVKNLDTKKVLYTKEEVKETVKEMTTENVRLKNQIKEMSKKTDKKGV